MSDTIIKVENIGKKYLLRHQTKDRYISLRDVIATKATALGRQLRILNSGRKDNPIYEEFWALKDVSFGVKRGEIIGIIGHNGAGKSTLLKILSRITEPTTGRIKIKGRVVSLLEVGTGFHPELTGRENIYLNGAILGMTKAEIRQKFNDIVEFAEVEKFLDTPVKRYSSGMFVRLAFAVAAHLKAEILMVDEVLAVGDIAFQKKCLNKMDDVVNDGRTVLFVSHNLKAIADICSRVIWINNGSIYKEGSSEILISDYLYNGSSISGYWQRSKKAIHSDELELTAATITQLGKKSNGLVNVNEYFNIEIEYKILCRLKESSVILQIVNCEGIIIFASWDTDSNGKLIHEREPGVYKSICKVPRHLLKPGRYSMNIAAHIYRKKMLDYQKSIITFEVSDIGYKFNPERKGIITPILNWIVE